jgi:hypothetical protein
VPESCHPQMPWQAGYPINTGDYAQKKTAFLVRPPIYNRDGLKFRNEINV